MCGDFERDNPSATATFTLDPPDDPVLACIARAGSDRPIGAAQAAVWIYRDKVSLESVNERFPVSIGDWASAGAIVRSCAERE